MTHIPRILRKPEVLAISGYRSTQIDELVARGAFPAPVKLSDGGRAKGWLEEEIAAWREARVAARDEKGLVR